MEITAPILIKDLGMMYLKETSKQKYRYGLYRCMCGNEFISLPYDVKVGKTKSCGCYQKKRASEAKTTHGMRGHRIYKTWANMMTRCYNANNKDFMYYGGAGIEVCESWHTPDNFIKDMLPTYKEGLTIDRIDHNGNYELSNCRWVNMNVQNRNKRKIQSNNTSGYRGVSWHKTSNRWSSYIGIYGDSKHLGYFNTALEAAKAYDKYVIDNNLEHTINGVL